MSPHKVIVNHILQNQASISDLHSISQVSLPTLRKAIQELSDAQWIRVIGLSEANGGRPAMLFGLDESYYLIVGVHLQLPGMRLITSDLTGQVLDVEEAFRNVVPQPDDVMQQIETYIRNVQKRYPNRQIIGVGIASPGFTEPDSGDIMSIGRVEGWQSIPICRHLRTRLELPVYIANDIDCMAFAEFQYSGTSFEQNLAYVGFDEGVKVSMFLNGQLYKGSFGNAGLIITKLLNLNEASTISRHHNILTIQGFNRIFAEQVSELNKSDQVNYEDILAIHDLRQRFQLIVRCDAEHLPICREVTQALIQSLVVAIVNITYVIQPDMLVLGGVLSLLPNVLYNQLEATIRQSLPSLFTNHLVIRQAILDSPNRAALGAIHHFLQTYFTESSLDLLKVTSNSG